MAHTGRDGGAVMRDKLLEEIGRENIETTQIYLDISEDALEQAHRKYV